MVNMNLDYALVDKLYAMGCIQNNKFKITKSFCENMSLPGLAIWYMDDGSLKHRDDSTASPTIILSTNSESRDEIDFLIDMLKNRFGIECNYRKEKKYGSIYITADGTQRFLNLVTPFIPMCMRYKTIPALMDVPYELENVVFEKHDRLLQTVVTDAKITNYRKSVFSNGRYSYDLKIQDNHNFFANRVLTHNCENMPWVLDQDKVWIQTEKLDGSSSTYAVDEIKKGKYEFIVCSRNVRQQSEDDVNYNTKESGTNVYWEMAHKYDIQNKLEQLASCGYKRVVLQGECIGEGVQGNPYKLQGRDFYVFNLIVDGTRLPSVEAAQWCKTNGLKHVPIISDCHELPKTMEEMKLEADGFSVINPKVKREGFVYRSQDGLQSFKNVSREYLLKHS